MEESSCNNNFGSESSDEEFTQTQDSSEVDENDEGVCEGEKGLESNGPILPPAVGRKFHSWDFAKMYYTYYGEQEGFKVVCASRVIRGKDGATKERKSYLWKCEYHGKPDCRRVNSKRVCCEVGNRKTKKCECPALMNITLSKEGVWVVKRAVLEHRNHTLTPYRHQELGDSVGRKLFNDSAFGVGTQEIHSSLARKQNSVENVAVPLTDVDNATDKARRLNFKDGDTTALDELFTKLSSNGQKFFHMERFDKFGILQDVMWVDARTRVAYVEFGDVVLFDSTCLTNDYELPLVNFVGVNHHGQSILLGCALLSHEDADTYQWLFRTWLSCMGKNPPVGILTDQGTEMRKALAIVMPNTQHRWYLGYILQKFYKKLRLHERYFELKESLFSAIYGCLTPEEFENSWSSAMKESKLESNDFLTGLYEERKMWVPAYMKHLLWAGMMTTKRVQSAKSFFAGCLEKHTRLSEFAPQYCNVMGSKAYDEDKADVDATIYRRQTATYFLVEQVFEKMYTDAKFLEVQSECLKLLYVDSLVQRNIHNHLVEHTIQDRVWKICQTSKKEIVTWDRRTYKVIFDTSSNEASCDCKLFECQGILCSHIIRVYFMHNVTEVPGKYILKRWKKDILRKHTPVKVAYHEPYISERRKRYNSLMAAFERICEKACRSKKCMAIVKDFLQKLEEKIDEMIQTIEKDDCNYASKICHS